LEIVVGDIAAETSNAIVNAATPPSYKGGGVVDRAIHAVGPRWSGGANGEVDLLARCHRRSVQITDELADATSPHDALNVLYY
jgi:O-acetyl-ADP-ribose deacetylase (regulator of RNase III)